MTKKQTWVKTGDAHYTSGIVAKDIVDFFKPIGKCLDPARGKGAFHSLLPEGADWCEITEGKNFFDYKERVDWIVTSPPYSMFNDWMEHSLEIANNIVYLLPVQKVFASWNRLKLLEKWGGVAHIRFYGTGHSIGFPLGFPFGAIHFKKGHKGAIEISGGC